MKNKMLGKTLKITGIWVGVIFLLLLLAPFLFKGKIIEMVKSTANDMLNAKVEFSDLNLSFIRNFPNASITIDDFSVVGVDEFEQDTLARFERLRVVADLKSIFGDQIVVKKILLKNPYAFAKVLPNGKANWDIMKETEEEETAEQDTTSSSFNLQLQSFVIENANVYYVDSTLNMSAALENLNFTLRGDMQQSVTNLDIYTTIERICYELDKVMLVNNADAEAKLLVQADLDNMKFTFGENSVRLNAIKLNFEGWLAMLENGYDMDIKLNAPTTQFKDLLSMIPAIYTKDFETIQTKGSLALDAYVKGQMIDSLYPSFDVKLKVADAYFKYPELPTSVDNINISAEASNPGGDLDLTELNVDNFSFQIGKNPFKIYLYAKNLLSDIYFKAGANGVLNLGTIKDVYPLDSMELSGILTADLALAGRMSYLDNEQYDKFSASGTLALNDAVYKSTDLPDVAISAMQMAFTSKNVALNKCDVQVANTDVHATGTLENYIAYVLKDETLKGTLNLTSNQIVVNDFVSDEETTETLATEPTATAETESADSLLLLPQNIDFTMKANLKKILYDKMTLDNLQGTITLKDGILNLKNANMGAFGGTMAMNATYDTSSEKDAKVAADLNIKEVLYTEVFKQMELVQKMAPIFECMTGKFSATMDFSGVMDETLSLVYPTVNGKGVIKSREVSVANLKALDAMAALLKNDDLKTLKAKNLTLPFEIKEGRVYTGPFDINSGNLAMTVQGSTGLDETIDYVTKVTIPQNVTSLPVKVDVKIGGTFDKPKVSLGASETLNAVKEVAKEKINEASQKLIDEAKAQKEKLVAEAQKAGEKLVTEARAAGDKLVAEAKVEADKAVEKASNPIAKLAAQKAADAAVKAAQKKSDDLVAAAQKQSDILVQTANTKGDELISTAESKSKIK